VAKSGM